VAGGQLSLAPMDIYHPDSIYPLLDGASMGSLGGPSSRLLGFAMVAQLAARCKIPIIGGGGLETWEHAVQFMMWGATLITVCTHLMWWGWDTIGETLRGMENFMASEGYAGYEALVWHLPQAGALRRDHAGGRHCLCRSRCLPGVWHLRSPLPGRCYLDVGIGGEDP